MPLNKPFIVGIGASAGGLKALEIFFSTVTKPTGMAFVVIQHLSPTHKTMMPELLERLTSLTVKMVDSASTIEADTIYLISPSTNLVAKNSALVAVPQNKEALLQLPIDIFLGSMAEEFLHRCAAVILSGTGSDGTLGCAKVREVGGLVMVQDPLQCGFDGMPVSAINRKVVDFTLKAELICSKITEISTEETYQIQEFEPDEVKLRIIFNMLLDIQGVDFNEYRRNTIVRRIDRRMVVNKCKTLDDYILFLKRDTHENRLLHDELLIGVTSFYRDTSTFEYIEETVIPKLIESTKPSESVRIWCAGCSTGQEAYTFAILLSEYFEKNSTHRDVKIFATDIDRTALSTGASGRFTENIISELKPEWLEKYFQRDAFELVISNKIRRMITFAQHNVLNDPPFTQMHLISCRNMLIYFLPKLQQKVLSYFHCGLKVNGTLFLGLSESLGALEEEFETISSKHRVFKKIKDTRLATINLVSNTSTNYQRGVPIAQRKQAETYSSRKEAQLLKTYEEILNLRMDSGFLVGSDRKIRYVFGDAAKYLKVSPGQLRPHITEMLGSDLADYISSGLSKVSSKNSKVLLENAHITKDRGQLSTIDILFQPLRQKVDTNISLILIEIEETNREVDTSSIIVEDVSQSQHQTSRIVDLESELTQSRNDLQTLVEEQEATNEELQSTNEELSSSNEELQSTNEELHSVNEELTTVNSEYKAKLEEIKEANFDIEFLLRSSKIGVVFLGEGLRIRRFNPGIDSLINLMIHDIGRPITELSFNFEHKEVISKLKLAKLKGEGSVFQAVHFNKTFVISISPTPAADKRSDDPSDNHSSELDGAGIVITLVDISESVERSDLKQIIESLNDFTYHVSHDLFQPLRHASSALKIMGEDLGSKRPEGFNQLSSHLTLMNRMLEQLLVYSRIRTSGSKLVISSLDLALKNCLKKMRPIIEKTETIIESSKLPSIKCDSLQIETVFKEIIKNSIEFRMPERKPSVIISSVEDEQTVMISIKDNGQGIHPSGHMRVFDLFYKSGLGENSDNLGTGLAHAKRIIERHNGKIWIDPNSEAGTTVCFSIPKS